MKEYKYFELRNYPETVPCRIIRVSKTDKSKEKVSYCVGELQRIWNNKNLYCIEISETYAKYIKKNDDGIFLHDLDTNKTFNF